MFSDLKLVRIRRIEFLNFVTVSLDRPCSSIAIKLNGDTVIRDQVKLLQVSNTYVDYFYHGR